ncbi:putative hemolysin [Rhizobium sp. BK529]|uniref:hemolysin family protein n=1 Tax=unclassified Rhizobium TaxID=2613769 RepID=UPI00104BB5FC|nr:MULTISPECIES: hemolysin family protein [unclassified Rhizobium]MBB3590374.1 putative hemolysin [Rhizobium sp. BK529]TCS05066.1 putative hemolysin [Rhizobium sp. BK418]
MYTEIAIVVLLTILNGVLAMSELAIVSARPARLKVLADQGSRGARLALRLAEDPGRFLSTVQIGITLVGVLSGAFSGATLGARFSAWLLAQGLPNAWADGLGVGSVVVIITYLSLIIGELVPKQMALRAPEALAARVAPTMTYLSKAALPLVWLLDGSGKLILALLGQSGKNADGVTDEEIKTVLAEAQSAGVIESGESAMITGVMRLADRTARALMTPRRDVELVDIEDSAEEIRKTIQSTSRTRLPARKGSSDEVLGVLAVKNYYDALAASRSVDIMTLVQEVPIISDLAPASSVIDAIRKSPQHMVLVYDEYGHFEGVITSGDILESIMGVFGEAASGEEPAIKRRDDGSYLVSGWTPIDEFSEFMNFPLDEDVEYQTVAGLVLEELKHLPELGETFVKNDWKFEVIDLDGRRVDKLLVSALTKDEARAET